MTICLVTLQNYKCWMKGLTISPWRFGHCSTPTIAWTKLGYLQPACTCSILLDHHWQSSAYVSFHKQKLMGKPSRKVANHLGKYPPPGLSFLPCNVLSFPSSLTHIRHSFLGLWQLHPPMTCNHICTPWPLPLASLKSLSHTHTCMHPPAPSFPGLHHTEAAHSQLTHVLHQASPPFCSTCARLTWDSLHFLHKSQYILGYDCLDCHHQMMWSHVTSCFMTTSFSSRNPYSNCSHNSRTTYAYLPWEWQTPNDISNWKIHTER